MKKSLIIIFSALIVIVLLFFLFVYHLPCGPPVPKVGQEIKHSWLDKIVINLRNFLKIKIQQNCPICLAENTFIDTPNGNYNIKSLEKGMDVWSVDRAGKRISVKIIKTSNVKVDNHHVIIKVLLDDGRELLVSPGHPTADGRYFGQLNVGNSIDNSIVNSLKKEIYVGVATYDILPSGETGFYWANGILVGSTLK